MTESAYKKFSFSIIQIKVQHNFKQFNINFFWHNGSMNTYLWRPNKGKISNTNLYLYSQFVKDNFQFDAKNDFNKLWKWSVKNP